MFANSGLAGLLTLVLVVLAAACAPAAATRAASSPTAASPATPSPGPTIMTSPVPSGPQQEPAQRARTDAAARAGVPIDRVQVLRIEDRQWPDSSLGCPAPGMLYSQVVTPGYLIVVQAGGRSFEYHTDRATRLVLCEGGKPV